MQKRESTISIHMSSPSQTSQPPATPSHPIPLGCHRAQCRAPCITQRLPTLSFTDGNICVSVLLSIPPARSSPHCVHMPVLCLCLCFCLADRFISAIFLDFIYMHEYVIFVFLTSLCVTRLWDIEYGFFPHERYYCSELCVPICFFSCFFFPVIKLTTSFENLVSCWL